MLVTLCKLKHKLFQRIGRCCFFKSFTKPIWKRKLFFIYYFYLRQNKIFSVQGNTIMLEQHSDVTVRCQLWRRKFVTDYYFASIKRRKTKTVYTCHILALMITFWSIYTNIHTYIHQKEIIKYNLTSNLLFHLSLIST